MSKRKAPEPIKDDLSTSSDTAPTDLLKQLCCRPKLKVNKNYSAFSSLPFATQSVHHKDGRKQVVLNDLSKFKISSHFNIFDRRVTALEWHPNHPFLMVAASKGGDVAVYNVNKPLPEKPCINGCGPGGSIQSIKFDPENVENLYAVCLDGTFSKKNYVTGHSQNFASTNNFDKWFVSCDISLDLKIAVAGSTEGTLNMHTLDGQLISQSKLHKKSKITHCEFSKREPWLLCTASNDKVVKLWDIRKMNKEEPCQPLAEFKNECVVNAAHFSRTDSCRLLITDQARHINIHRAPLYHLERTIEHPHRKFQHLTPIRADWHPLEDIIIIGRYPDPNFNDETKETPRTVDVFDADTGELLHQLGANNPHFNGVKSINRFNKIGSILASSSAGGIIFWSRDNSDSVDDKHPLRQTVSKKSVLPPKPCPRKADSKKAMKKKKG